MRNGLVCLFIFFLLMLTACKTSTTSKEVTDTNTTSSNTTHTKTTIVQPELPYVFDNLKTTNFNIKTHEKVEWLFTTKELDGKPFDKSLVNPFNPDEIDLIGEFTSPNGEVISLPAFWYENFTRSMQELSSLQGITDKWVGSGNDYAQMEIAEKENVYVAKVAFNASNGEFKKVGQNFSTTSNDAEKFTHIRVTSAGMGLNEKVRFEFYSPSGSPYVLIDLSNPNLNEQIIPLSTDHVVKINQSTWIQFYPAGPVSSNFYIHKIELYNPTTLESKLIVDFNEEAIKANTPIIKEQLTDTYGDGFRLRFTPTVPGQWHVKVKIKLNNQYFEVLAKDFQVEECNNKGFIRVNQETKRSFSYENGSPYIPIGQNVAWWDASKDAKSYDYDTWYELMGENNANFSRVWMSAWGYSLFWDDYDNYLSRMDEAYRLDLNFDKALEEGINIDLVLFHHGQFSTNVNSNWNENPFNKKRGGFLSNPYEFFVNEDAMKYAKQYLRYMVARYGYATNLFTWELFNEVQFTDLYNDSYNGSLTLQQGKEASRNWHKVMSEYLKEIDPYHHLVTSSGENNELFHQLETIDFVAIHSYSTLEFSVLLSQLTYDYFDVRKNNKPILMGELGITTSSASVLNQDPSGIHMHQAQWAGLMTGFAGPAHVWYWDIYTHKFDLYSLFKPVSIYTEQMDLGKADLSVIRNGLTLSNSELSYRGYGNQNTIYLWIIQKGYTYLNPNAKEYSNETITVSIENGTYHVKWFNTYSGEFFEEQTITVTNGSAVITIPSFSKDIALIVEK